MKTNTQTTVATLPRKLQLQLALILATPSPPPKQPATKR